jgi:hypothetical protein
MILCIDQGDSSRRALQTANDLQPGKSGPYHNDSSRITRHHGKTGPRPWTGRAPSVGTRCLAHDGLVVSLSAPLMWHLPIQSLNLYSKAAWFRFTQLPRHMRLDDDQPMFLSPERIARCRWMIGNDISATERSCGLPPLFK